MSLKPKDVGRQLTLLLTHQEVDLVLDVGANTGQYAKRLRRDGYTGRILSFEPLPDLHAGLVATAEADRDWIIAPPMALGAASGTATLQRSAESDMSSLRYQTALLERLSPSSAVIEEVPVRVERLDRVVPTLADAKRPFLKLDIQGGEADALDGAAALLPTLTGLQIEMSLVPCYEGEADFRSMTDRLHRLGFDLAMVLPGYFDGKVCRQLQVDGVFLRPLT